jgi:hypothetical protein
VLEIDIVLQIVLDVGSALPRRFSRLRSTPLLNQPRREKEAFVRRLFQCGIVDRVLEGLTARI